MLRGQLASDPLDDLGIMAGAPHYFANQLFRMLPPEDEVAGRLAVSFLDEVGVKAEQRDRVGRGCLKRSARDELKMLKQRAINDRREDALTHAGNDLIEADGRRNRDVEAPQIIGIVGIRVGTDRVVGPWRRPVPAMAGNTDWPDLGAHTLDRFEDPAQLAPAEPVVADVEHAIALVA